jgi:hypothetical protein
MKTQWAKVIHAAGELAAFFIHRGARDIEVRHRMEGTALESTIRARDLELDPEDMGRLRTRLVHPVQREIGEYYWGLAGGEHRGTELEVVGNAVEVLELETAPGEGTWIRIRRR